MRKLAMPILIALVSLTGLSAAAQDAQWIWFPAGDPKADAPDLTYYFRKTVEIPKDCLGAWLWIAADNAYKVYFNGELAGQGADWQKPGVYSLTGQLKPGANTIAVEADNQGGPAGLIALARIWPAEGDEILIGTDNTWKTTNISEEGWTQPAFDHAGWEDALVLGPVPCQPWEQLTTFGDILTMDISRTTLTPNGDGLNDTVDISFSFPPGELGGVLVDVLDASRSLIFSHAGKGECSNTITWNGRYETGGMVPEGEYRIVVFGQAKRHEFSEERTIKIRDLGAWPEAPNHTKDLFPIGVWYDGRVEGINVPEGCTNVPAGLPEAEAYYLRTFKDIRNHNIDIVVIPNTPPQYREVLLSAATRAQVKVILEIAEFAWPEFGDTVCIRNPEMTRDELEAYSAIRTITRPLQKHGSLLAYQLIDEPPAELFDNWRTVSRLLGVVDKNRFPFSCLCNENELDKAVELGMQAITFDRYPLGPNTAPGEYDFKAFAGLLENLRDSAAGAQVPFWMVVQSCAAPLKLRYPEPAELRLMTYLSLSRNAKGIFFFLYNSKTQQERLEGLVDVDLKPAPLYDEVTALGRELKTLAPILLKLAPAESIASSDGEDTDVQSFVHADGTRYIIACNLNVLESIQCPLAISTGAQKAVNVLTGEQHPIEKVDGKNVASVSLDPGCGVLLKLK